MSKPFTFSYTDGLPLESGASLASFKLAYHTYGTLNKDKSNAILICHALSGDSQVGGATGWWSSVVGPGKSIDTFKYYVVCVNSLGSCYGSTGPMSETPDTGKPYAMDFPVITIGDMVSAQRKLMDILDVHKWRAVVGPSMGGMQALEWSIMYPDKVDMCIPLVTTARLSTAALAFGSIGRNAITTDPNWNNGNYYDQEGPETGLSIARMIGHITYLSHEGLSQKFGRRLQEKQDYSYDFSSDFQIESYLKHQGDKFVSRFDANAYLYLSRAMSYFDLAKKYGSLNDAFDKTQANFLVMSISSDTLYPSSQSKEIVKTLMKLNRSVTFVEVNSPHGHDGFLIEADVINNVLRSYLENAPCH